MTNLADQAPASQSSAPIVPPVSPEAAAERQESIVNPTCQVVPNAKLEGDFPIAGSPPPSGNRETGSLIAVKRELQYYRNKAIEQDIEIFEMRALLQSGKGLSNILNLKQLLETFMAVVREKYSAINTAVLLKDDLENSQDFYRVKAHYGLDDKFIHESGMEESIFMFKFPKNAGLLWQLIQQGNVFSVRDMQR